MSVVKVENLSKIYDLGLVGTGTLSKDINRFWAKIRGKPDPYSEFVELNDRTQKSKSDLVYALKDISFNVERGEVLGIVGKNGAGKSTLLKVLSQVTNPTNGVIKIKGRVASLLEVGTGMHPEMTARQNIYLNGAIMGMMRQEISSKLDEIVDFAGIAKYVDTPIKRFSSGMKVRLGFAVAAFLEPEILIVDEVLAVGDAEFQKKAIGKMQDVSIDKGRTVLFVSHNMAAVKSLCNRGIWIDKGQLKEEGDVNRVISNYMIGDATLINYKKIEISAFDFILHSVGVKSKNKTYNDPISMEDEIEFHFNYTNSSLKNIHITLKIKGEDGQYVMTTSSNHEENIITQGLNEVTMTLPKFLLNDMSFYVDIFVVVDKRHAIIMEKDVFSFIVNPEKRELGSWSGKELGYFRGQFNWTLL